MTPLIRIASVGALAAALATSACNRTPDATGGNAQAQFALPALPATLPLEAGAATDIAPAPSASDLPAAAPLRLARVADPNQSYGYADAAFGYDEALGDAPPDYGFDYDGADPWAWQGYDESLMVAEPVDDGGYRYYYYRPGADAPYFVRDPYYSYGFAGGLLAVVYGADGGIVPYADYGPRLGYASRYYARGRSLWGASRRGGRRSVIAADWLRRRPVILAARDRWGAGRAHQPGWQHYHEANGPRQASYWQAEQVRRQADSRRFADWREGGFRTAPPARAIPAAWAKAKWAQDDRRYRPAAEAPRHGRDVGDPPADRREARQVQDRREQAQAERQAQRAQAAPGRRPEAERRAEQAQPRDAVQAQRPAARAERQHSAQANRPQAPHRQIQQAQRRDTQPTGGQQAQQAERAQRQQMQEARREPAEIGRRPAQQGERTQRGQAQQAERAQAQQALGAERQQAQQAQQAQRQQAQQAQAVGRQAARQQARQAERLQVQPQSPQPRAERPGGGRRSNGPGTN